MKGFEGVEFCKDGFVRVAPEKVQRLTDPNAGRTEEEIERMKSSLRANGQLNSAAGYLDPDLGVVILVDGSTRAEAMRRLNAELEEGHAPWELEVKLVDPETFGHEEEGSKESLLVGLAANLDRGTMSGMSIAHSLQTLREKGMEVEDIARRLGRSPAWVREHLKLLSNASPEVQKAVETGKISSSSAVKLAKLEPERQGPVLERLLKEGDGLVTRDSIARAVREETQAEDRKVPAATMTEWRGIVDQWVESPQALPEAFWELASILQQFNVGKIRKESTLRGKIQEILEAVEKGTLSGTEIAEEAIEEEKPKKKRGKKAEKEKEG